MEPIPLKTVVLYHGERYVVTGHRAPRLLFSVAALERMEAEGVILDEEYPDGVAYDIFPVGMPWRFGNIRDYSVWRVRRKSLTVVDDG